MAVRGRPFPPGNNANPNGRPKKDRALTAILEAAGSRGVEVGGKRISRQRLAAEHVWQIVTEGKTTMPDGSVVKPRPRDYLETLRWLYGHIDGPPKQQVEMSSDPERPVRFEVAAVDYRTVISPLAPPELAEG